MKNNISYSKKVLDYFDKPKYCGTIKENSNVFISTVQGIEKGNFIKFFVEVNKNIITKIKYKVRGCPYTVAACEYTAEMLLNKNIDKLPFFNYEKIAQELDLPQTKLHCAILVEEGINEISKSFHKD